MDNFDLVILGAGPGGYATALEAAKKGLRTAVVDPQRAGGTCLNRGCIPTKTLMHTSQLYREAREAADTGLTLREASLDMERLAAYKDGVIEKLSSGIEGLFRRSKIAFFRGSGTVTAPGEVTVSGGDSRVISGRNILIATGSFPARLPLPGVDLPGVLNSDMLLAEPKKYARLTIIGGGVIGMEFAALYADLGCAVTVIEALDRTLANMDREFGQSLRLILKKRGVDIHTSAALREIRQAEGGLECVYTEKGAEASALSDAVLVAVGRKPASAGVFAEGLAPEMERGFIKVDGNYETSLPGVYAVGDVIGGVQLAHAASAEGLCALAAMLGEKAPVRADLIPACVYSSPEIASVGITADDAKKQGLAAVSKKYPMSANGRSVLSGAERGYMKLVTEPETGVILGAQLMCERATDMIGELVSAVANGFTVNELSRAVRPHPSFNEALCELLRL